VAEGDGALPLLVPEHERVRAQGRCEHQTTRLEHTLDIPRVGRQTQPRALARPGPPKRQTRGQPPRWEATSARADLGSRPPGVLKGPGSPFSRRRPRPICDTTPPQSWSTTTAWIPRRGDGQIG
jgi:hypothetical protein